MLKPTVGSGAGCGWGGDVGLRGEGGARRRGGMEVARGNGVRNSWPRDFCIGWDGIRAGWKVK